MNIAQVEENVKILLAGLVTGDVQQPDFIYELLLAYGHRKQSVTRLRSGERNLASKSNEPRHDEIIWKRQLYYKHVEGNALHTEIDQMRKEKLVTTNKIRFVIVTNFDQLLAYDIKTQDSLDISLDELPAKFDFFLPWAGMEKAVYQGENPADVKAAEKMAKLFDLIKNDNFDESNKDDTEALHNLNVFLTRLLFCFFAEDTEIFTDNQFSLAIESHTEDSGSDLPEYLSRLFTVLNTADSARGELPDYLADFPYVNGGLFADDIRTPNFSTKSRRMLIECGSELDWSDINPDIFGSMIQAVVHPDQRGGMGMHYTSVTNIMKVIEPLFLNDLYEELEKVESSATKLKKLQQRLGEIKIFDPACGSGNFLIIAYKELRKLEMEVLKRLQEINDEKQDVKSGVMAQIFHPLSVIQLSQFYGIELDDFAHEVAILSLWLAEHQMNVEFKAEFGESKPSLPLQNVCGIISGNAVGLDWCDICEPDGEVYLLGNPPYVGSTWQSLKQKEDLALLCAGMKNYRNMDYVSCWFIKGAEFILKGNAKLAFVSTNSVCQGDHVALLWPLLLSKDVEIDFAYTSFKWSNHAKGNAGVTCVIVALRNLSKSKKELYTNGLVVKAKNINPYLVAAKNCIVGRRSSPISNLPKMVWGNKPTDGGHLILSEEESKSIVSGFPAAKRFIKKYVGSQELIKGLRRYCIWIEDDELELANKIEPIRQRIKLVKEMRLASKAASTVAKADTSHKFIQIQDVGKPGVIVPEVSSERRLYLPVGFVDSETVVNNLAQVIYNSELYIFSLLVSAMHMTWVRAVAGALETRIRYSSGVCYNSFPVPEISESQVEGLRSSALDILSLREAYPDMSLGDLYDPDKIPSDLLEAHKRNDVLAESIYSKTGFISEEQRLECLFSMYENMTEGQNA